MSLHAYTLYSSSSGNCTCVTDGETTVLIDAGGSLKRLTLGLRGLGLEPEDVDAVFVTHEHTDHIAALRCFSKKYSAPIHAACQSAPFIDSPNVVSHPPVYTERVGGLCIASFPVSHDSACCVGYTVCRGEEKIASVTDTGIVTDAIREAIYGCRAVILESNYDEAMLMSGSYPYALKQRIRSRFGHLSNADSSEFLRELSGDGVRSFLLAHLSAENNEPPAALSCALNALYAGNINGVEVRVAPRLEAAALL